MFLNCRSAAAAFARINFAAPCCVVFLLCEARNPFSSKLMLTKVCMYVYFIFYSNGMNSKSKLFFIQTHKIHEYNYSAYGTDADEKNCALFIQILN
jgi:hypothetical protein